MIDLFTSFILFETLEDRAFMVISFIRLLAENGIKLYGFVNYLVKKIENFDIETMTKKVQYKFIATEITF